ncbi:MAG: L-histidine N(alpha)-methyltransferase [Acidimicrobiales bacterium]|nr:L-histidine N(alpha)-methyltransferase [Acidimicrobiales bacterium]
MLPDELDRALRADVRAGLTATPKVLPPKWFYDQRGSELFDEITRLDEYYPTRREREIIEREAAAVAAFGATTVVELGAGTSEKTRLLLDAMVADGRLARFVPFDVSEEFLRSAAATIADEYPGLDVHAVVGDFERHLPALADLPGEGPRLVVFLGGTIGNLDPSQRAAFHEALASALRPGDGLLLGTDLVKDPARLVRAYDDAAGVTAEFNTNVLRVINRHLDADFDPSRFRHVACWDADAEWIEMRLRSVGPQVAHVGALDLTVPFDDGEEIRTEISAKFRRAGVERELAAAGFALERWWTDAAGDFALSLSVRR